MKTIILIFTLGLISNVNAQNLYWTSSFGGENGNGAMINYDINAGQLEPSISLEGNPLAPWSVYQNSLTLSDTREHEFGGLLAAADGYIYGIDHHAGVGANSLSQGVESGMLYRFLPGTNKVEVLHTFTGSNYMFNSLLHEGSLLKGYSKPRFSIIEGQPGVLYGICIAGGQDNHGGIWKFEIATGLYTQLDDFSSTTIGTNPTSSLFIGPNGDLYGVLANNTINNTFGRLYKLDLTSEVLSSISDLDAAGAAIFSPYGDVIYEPSTNKMYGTKRFDFAPFGGGVYSYNFNTNTDLNIVGIFGSYFINGSDMRGMSFANDGKKYAVSANHAGGGFGALNVFNLANSSLTAIHSFTARPRGNGMVAHGTKLYGTYENIGNDIDYNMWSYDVSNGTFQDIFPVNATSGKGILPQFTIVNDKIYARTISGDSTSTGFICEIDLATLTVSAIIDGHSPNGSVAVGELLSLENGEFLGFTQTDGSTNPSYANFEGNIVKYDLLNNSVTNVATLEIIPEAVSSFSKYGPISFKAPKLTLGSDGKVYFTYASYGNDFLSQIESSYNNQLVLCELDLSTNQITIVDNTLFFAFGGVSSVLEYEPGKLLYTAGDHVKVYNTTTNSLEFDEVKINEDATGLFYGNTTLASDGLIYGFTRKTTEYNQQASAKIYSLDPANNFDYTEMHSFDSIINEANIGLTEYMGKLYGSTSTGGVSNHGYLFSYEIATTTFAIEHEFDVVTDGAVFAAQWTLNDDKLFSTSFSGGQNGYGTLVEYDLINSTMTTLEDFTITNGRSFRGSPVLFDDSNLGINDISKSITIYPNPTERFIYVENGNIQDVSVYSIDGKKEKVDFDKMKIDLEGLSPGVYILNIEIPEGQFQKRVIIK